MMSFRVLFGSSLLAACLLFFACGSDSATSPSNPRTVTVTIKNLENIASVHVFFDLEEPGEENLVPPQDSIVGHVLVRQIGQSVSVHVAEGDKPGAPTFYSTNIRVTQISWDSREAEIQWTGSEIIPVGW